MAWIRIRVEMIKWRKLEKIELAKLRKEIGAEGGILEIKRVTNYSTENSSSSKIRNIWIRSEKSQENIDKIREGKRERYSKEKL